MDMRLIGLTLIERTISMCVYVYVLLFFVESFKHRAMRCTQNPNILQLILLVVITAAAAATAIVIRSHGLRSSIIDLFVVFC